MYLAAGNAFAQQSAISPFETKLRPTFWYNSKDGVQIGGRFLMYRDNPELGDLRLYTGVWLNTFFPDIPVSYSVRFENPIPILSAPSEEFTFRLTSSLREGHTRHVIGLRKRIATGRLDDQFVMLKVGLDYYRQFDDEYLLFQNSWSDRQHYLPQAGVYFRNANVAGRYQTLEATFTGFTGTDNHRLNVSGSWVEPLGSYFTLSGAFLFAKHFSENTRPEHATHYAIEYGYNQHENPWFRSHGPMPATWVRNGIATNYRQTAVLRGYAKHDIERIKNGTAGDLSDLMVFSLEADVFNPIDAKLRDVSYAGVFMKFRTYLFADVGYVDRFNVPVRESVPANAGAGLMFNFNLPDYVGERRGFTIRWDLPVWVSDPVQGENPFQFRGQFSFDLTIPF